MPLNVQKNNELMEDIEHAFLKKTNEAMYKAITGKVIGTRF